MSAETWRWLIGGGLTLIVGCLIYLVKAAYNLGGVLKEIASKFARHEEMHAQHSDRAQAHEVEIKEINHWRWKHSGESAASRLEPRS